MQDNETELDDSTELEDRYECRNCERQFYELHAYCPCCDWATIEESEPSTENIEPDGEEHGWVLIAEMVGDDLPDKDEVAYLSEAYFAVEMRERLAEQPTISSNTEGEKR